jgi:hypothetical protein
LGIVRGPRSLGIGIINEVFHGIAWDDVESVSFRMNGSEAEKGVYNVVGMVEGRDRSQAVVVGAHFDGVGYAGGYHTRGALDNASGVAAMVRVAGLIAAKEGMPETDIMFAAFNGEENGRWGSNAFAEELLAGAFYDKIFFINFDCKGSVKAMPYAIRLPYNLSLPLAPFLDDWGIGHIDEYPGNSDDISFYAREVPYVALVPTYEHLGSLIHCDKDVKESLDYALIDNTAKMIVGYIGAIGADLPVWERAGVGKRLIREPIF